MNKEGIVSQLSAKAPEQKDSIVLMVMFDSLFDMRAAALRVLSPEYLSTIKLDQTYYNRRHDSFGDDELGFIYKEQIDSIVNSQVDKTLQNCYPSRISETVCEFCLEYMQNTDMGPMPKNIEVVLNFGKYPFEDNQIKNIIEHYKKILEPLKVTLKCTDLKISELSANTMKNVDALIVYDYLAFLSLHEKDIQSGNYSHLKIYCPKSYPYMNGGLEKYETVKRELKSIRQDIYSLIRKSIARYIDIQFIPVKYYCDLDAFNNFKFEDYALDKINDKNKK